MKKFPILIFMLISLVCSVCFAEIPRSEVALGGVPLGSTPEYVKSIYGEPSSYDRGGWR